MSFMLPFENSGELLIALQNTSKFSEYQLKKNVLDYQQENMLQGYEGLYPSPLCSLPA